MKGLVPVRWWTVETKSILVVVPGKDQWEAYDSLRNFPKEDFGLLVIAKEGRSGEGDEISARTSSLMFRWGRRFDAQAFINEAIRQGLPDTTELDRLSAGPPKEAPKKGVPP